MHQDDVKGKAGPDESGPRRKRARSDDEPGGWLSTVGELGSCCSTLAVVVLALFCLSAAAAGWAARHRP